jgi:hypothetical protein
LKSRFWIPPIPLAASVGFQFVAWCLVLVDAVRPSFDVELAWIHAVALGWLTLTALAVLLHVIPGFTDLAWRAESIARATVIVVAAAAFALVISFAAGSTGGVAAFGAILGVAIVLYATLAIWSLSARTADRRSATIARGLMLAVIALAATAILGSGLAGAFANANAKFLAFAPSHAVLGIAAWLTVLTTGVSARTFRPLLGLQSRWPRAHALAGSGLLLGSVVAAATAPWSVLLFRTGMLLTAAGAFAYVVDAADILRRARGPHAAVRAFVAASVAWLAVAAALAVGASWGAPVAGTAIVVALAGWLGQMVNAHLHHLGVRVVSTAVLGDEDETRPWTLLAPALSWTAFAAGQIAVIAVALRAQGAPAAYAWLGGAAGLTGLFAMAMNVATVIRRARRQTAAG